MAGIPMTTQRGQRTYKVVEAVTGGQVVEARTGGIGVAAAGSVKALGVAISDAAPNANLEATSTTGADGRSLLVAVALPPNVTVVSSGQEVPVTYAAPAAFGDKLVAASLGRVTPAAATPDARTIVGTCTELAGVTAAGRTGLMRTA